jgi:eukaryotic-like serine/threonine-protein kinase
VADERLELGRRLGAGGMAEVFLGKQRLADGTSRTVAVKRLSPEYRGDREYQLMLLDESRILSRLCHPNVVRLLETASWSGDPILVFEYVPGVSLRSALEQSRLCPASLPRDVAAAIALGVAAGLCYVHAARDEAGRWLRIVHRDLNPTNILVSRDGVPKIIDFGIARGEGRVYETATGTTKGSIAYMAPEQLSASVELDQRVDVFAFGIVLYELFTGVHPFAARTATELFERLETAEFVPPRALAPELPGELCRAIEESLARDRDCRPADVHEVASLIESACSSAGWRPTPSCVSNWIRKL